jgi:hypothetical protein
VQERGAIAHYIGSLTSKFRWDGLLGFAGHARILARGVSHREGLTYKRVLFL